MANRIREIREDRCLSQEALGQKCVPVAGKMQISKLERGLNQLTDRWMYRLAGALECHPAELLSDEAALKPDEAKLLDTYRGLAEEGRDTVKRFLDSFKRPNGSDVPQGQ